MSNYIVLVKQVPDVARITDNAFDPETGNLIRSRLASVINELDAQALAFAHRMKEISGQEGKIICLSMGPPMAAEVLRYGLSRGADGAVLLTDRALGGADTWATANPLAHAIRRITAEMLDGTRNFFIICGMQSVDGDTAQVPPQIAEDLSIPCIPYATEPFFEEGGFRFNCIIAGGSQLVETLSMPAVITVANYDYPLFASLAATRHANRLAPTQWGAADVKPTSMGISGSKTRVIRVFAPEKSGRLAQQMKSVQELARHIAGALSEVDETRIRGEAGQSAYILPDRRASALDRSFEGTEKESAEFDVLTRLLAEMNITEPAQLTSELREKILASGAAPFPPKILADMLEGLTHTAPAYSGEVWVMAEHEEGRINAATFELTGKARELADSLEVEVGVVLVGHQIKPLAAELIAAGADIVYTIEHPLLEHFDPVSHRKAVADLFERYKPQILLFGATPQGRVLAPMISYRVGCGLTADCTGLAIRDNSRKKQIALLMQTRPALGGNVMATISSRNSSCQMATARPGVMKRLPVDPGRAGRIITHSVAITEADLSLKILRMERGHGLVNFSCDLIVSGGKGLQTRDAFDRLLGNLCATAREQFRVSVEKGASRAAVELGFADRIHQVGQTSTAVGPKLYIAIGISGAIQHMIGVASARTVIAINSDPHAPIFKQSDYYLVGRAEKIVPELVEALKEMSLGG
jgi:electron transfer flavoprotein alpha subunit